MPASTLLNRDHGGKEMNENKGHESTNSPKKGNPQGSENDPQGNPSGQPDRDRSQADDQGLRRRPDSEPAIPELPEPDVEGVGNEGGENSTDATMPPGEGQNPKRNTM